MRQAQSRGSRLRVTQLEDRLTPAALLPAGFAEVAITNSNAAPTRLVFSPQGKMYVLEQAGSIKVYEGQGNSWTQVAPSGNFFTGNPLDVYINTETGLLGLEFDPSFASNRYVYVYYTVNSTPAHNRISRFTANATGTQVVTGSEEIIVELDDHLTEFHNGGDMHFGADGKLYVATGDDASWPNATDVRTRHGKILRINPDPANPIPSDNPTQFEGVLAGDGITTGDNRMIWAIGLRNPFSFTIHPVTGLMYIADVGQGYYEEVNVGAAGANYGWGPTEGPFNPLAYPSLTHPLLAYSHPNLNLPNYPATPEYQGYAIVGGSFLTQASTSFPSEYLNDYFYADFVSGWIRRYDVNEGVSYPFATDMYNSPVALTTGPDGSLYYVSHSTGRVHRIDYTGSTAPYIVEQPTAQSTVVGGSATFQVNSGGPNLSWQWQRNGVDIPGADFWTYTVTNVQLSNNGDSYRVVVSNGSGSVVSESATLVVGVNQPPVPVIITPSFGAKFNYGDTISFSGSAIDPEEGPLTNPESLTWRIDYHTGSVIRPFMPFAQGPNGTIVIPTLSPYTAADVFFRIHLFATDSLGAQSEVTMDVLPNIVELTLQSEPAGISLNLSGSSYVAPETIEVVPGLERTLSAPNRTTIGGLAYEFLEWSNGEPIVHTISTPSVDSTFTATYEHVPGVVQSVIVNDGTAQRSIIRTFTITFEVIVSPLTTLESAFDLIGPNGNVPLIGGVIDNSTGQSIITVTVSGPGLEYGSLPDGLYSLSIVGDQLVDALSTPVDGNANGMAGGEYNFEFHRLFGDADGNGSISAYDYNAFRLVYGTTGPSIFDFNGDNHVSAADFNAIRTRFGTMIVP